MGITLSCWQRIFETADQQQQCQGVTFWGGVCTCKSSRAAWLDWLTSIVVQPAVGAAQGANF
jgi:hypothetical protein